MTPHHEPNTLQFIQFEGPNNDALKREHRKSVRAHVMRRFQQHRRAQSRLQISQALDAKSGQTPIDNGPRHSFECAEAEEGDQLARVSSIGYPQGNLASPRRTHYLVLQHVGYIEACCARLSPQQRQSPLTTYWLPASMNHPLLFYASLFTCSAALETLSQQPLSHTSYLNRGKAIGLINAGLSDPITRKSDEIVAAVLSLANFECLSGNTPALAHHVAGLRDLAKIRGGAEVLGMEGLLMRLIDLYSWFLDTFPHQDSKSSTTEAATVFPEHSTFSRLFGLSENLDTPGSRHQPFVDGLRSVYERLVNGSQRESPAYSNGFDLPGPGLAWTCAKEQYIYKSCNTATAIWTGVAPVSVQSAPLRYSLKDSLEQTNLDEGWLPVPGALLWCFLVGVYNSRGDEVLHPWFVSQLLRFWLPLSLHRWKELQHSLTWFRWLLAHGPSRPLE